MLQTLAIGNYRSLVDLIVPLARLNLVTGANGSGKSNLYRALRLLAESARGGVVGALAREGGIASTYWAGPENLSRDMRSGAAPVQGTVRRQPQRLRLGFSGEEFGYAISLGYPVPGETAFGLDPEIKRESIWAGTAWRPAAILVDRENQAVRARGDDGAWRMLGVPIGAFDSIFNQLADAEVTPEIFRVREQIRGWRFYDHFRTDSAAPARLEHVGTRTPVLHHDGHDLAAALQTIREIGDGQALDAAVLDAFPGARVEILNRDTRFGIAFHQHGLLRPLSAREPSDGTLRYLLWTAALLSPRPPSLMVLNEPETSLHPDLLPALGRLIVRASTRSQVWVVSHAPSLIAALSSHRECHVIALEKELGETRVVDQGMLDRPAWRWPD